MEWMNAYISIMLTWILTKEGIQWIKRTQERIHSFDTRKGFSSWAQHLLLQYDLAAWGQYIINPTESQKVLGIRRQSGRKDCLPWPNHSHIFNIQRVFSKLGLLCGQTMQYTELSVSFN
jgi:hypothetical protein